MTTALELAAVIGARSYNYASEYELHLGIEAALTLAGHTPMPEYRIPQGRLDFMVDGVAIEVKVGGTADALMRQLIRYAGCAEVRELLAVSTRRDHVADMPDHIGGKPLVHCHIGGL